MKFRVEFKTPDALDAGISQAILDESSDDNFHLSDEAVALDESMRLLANKFIRRGEYLTVEFDTADHSATLIEIK